MRIVYLKSLPYNNRRIYEQIYEGVRKRANSFTYLENDRIKKICGCNENKVGNLSYLPIKDINVKPFVYQIFLVDPTDEQIEQMKFKMLELQKKQFEQQISVYSDNINKIDKYLKRINKN